MNYIKVLSICDKIIVKGEEGGNSYLIILNMFQTYMWYTILDKYDQSGSLLLLICVHIVGRTKPNLAYGNSQSINIQTNTSFLLVKFVNPYLSVSNLWTCGERNRRSCRLELITLVANCIKRFIQKCLLPMEI